MWIFGVAPADMLNWQNMSKHFFVSWEIRSNAANMAPLSRLVCLDSNKFDQMVP